MRLSGLLALATLGCACARVNPAYGEQGVGSETGSSGSSGSGETTVWSSSVGMTSEASSDATDTPDPGLLCEEPHFVIEGPHAPTCPPASVDPFHCVSLTDWGGNRLRGFKSEGCEQGPCDVVSDEEFEVGVEGLDLPSLFTEKVGDGAACVWIAVRASARDGQCSFDRLGVWGVDGYLHLALGNGPPDPDPMLARPPMGNPIPITSLFSDETDCGELGSCDRSGFRSIVVGMGTEAALPDGEPVSALLPGVGTPDEVSAYSAFNWGLQYDLSCEARGRWAVVPAAHESLFE